MLLSLITPTPPDHQHGVDTTVTDTDTCFRHPPPMPPVYPHGNCTTDAQEYRVESHMDGVEEFSRYSGDADVSREEWLQKLSEPPRTTAQV